MENIPFRGVLSGSIRCWCALIVLLSTWRDFQVASEMAVTSAPVSTLKGVLSPPRRISTIQAEDVMVLRYNSGRRIL